jgi:hypothetical protein
MELLFLLALTLDTGRPRTGSGDIYSTDPYAGVLTARDAAGKVRWTVGSLPHCMGLAARRGGGCFVGIDGGIVEIAADGTTVRRIKLGISDLKYVTGLQALDGDRFLVVDFNPGTIAIVDAEGRVLWRAAEGQFYDARRAPNGRVYAVGPRGRIDELDDAGKIVRSFDAGGTGVWIELLPKGGFLVVLSDQGEVAEFDSEGRKVKSATGLSTPYSAQRLRNGRTLVAERGNRRILELDLDGRTVREFPQVGALRAAMRF